MTVYITEHAGNPWVQLANNKPLASYALTSASVATPSSLAQYIRVSADAGSFLGLYGSTTVALTSTNAFRVPANVGAELFPIAVGTTTKIMAAST